MVDLRPIFDWLSQPAETRDAAYSDVVKKRLLSIWHEARDRIGPEGFDSVLGSMRAGKFMTRSKGAWVQTNSERDSGFVNMTLEIDASELSLNVIGWFDPQLAKVESWLRKPTAWRFLREHPDWILVVFVRKAHIGTEGKAVFQGAPGLELERIDLSTTSPANLSTTITGLRPRLDSSTEKLSLHIKRAWNREEVAALDDISAAVAREVEYWLKPIQEIRLA